MLTIVDRVGPPPHIYVANWRDCSGSKDMGGWTAACKPADRPHDCPLESWEKLFGENGVADYFEPCRQQVTGPPYTMVPNVEDCVQRREQGTMISFNDYVTYEDSCQPLRRPANCPIDSWNQLFGQNGVGLVLPPCFGEFLHSKTLLETNF